MDNDGEMRDHWQGSDPSRGGNSSGKYERGLEDYDPTDSDPTLTGREVEPGMSELAMEDYGSPDPDVPFTGNSDAPEEGPRASDDPTGSRSEDVGQFGQFENTGIGTDLTAEMNTPGPDNPDPTV